MKQCSKRSLFSTVVLFSLLLVLLSLSGCTESAVLDEIVVHDIQHPIHTLYIKINAAEFTIRDSDRFYVESNLKYLTVNAQNGVLTISEETKPGVAYDGPILVLHMPTDTLFEKVRITTGAGKLSTSELNAKELEMTLGAGDLSIGKLRVTTDAKIVGGAGTITISDGSIQDLDLEMGLGKLNLAAMILGNSDLTLGVGESNIQLLGGRDIYKIDIEKGLGQLTIDGTKLDEFTTSGNGVNSLDIEGGIGAINISFAG